MAMGALAAGQAQAARIHDPGSFYIHSPIHDPVSFFMPSPTLFFMPSPTAGQQAQAARVYGPSPMQTFFVDSRTNVFPIGQPKVSSAILDAGAWYKFVVTGEWTPDYRYGTFSLEQLQANPALLAQVPWRADARFATEDTWVTNSDFDPKNYDDFGLHSSFIGAGDDDFWGASNANHSYEYEVLGSGQSADFYVQDVNSFDNFGGYTVKLYRAADVSPASVPGPLPALGAAAALGFSRKLRKRIKGSTNALSSCNSL